MLLMVSAKAGLLAARFTTKLNNQGRLASC